MVEQGKVERTSRLRLLLNDLGRILGALNCMFWVNGVAYPSGEFVDITPPGSPLQISVTLICDPKGVPISLPSPQPFQNPRDQSPLADLPREISVADPSAKRWRKLQARKK